MKGTETDLSVHVHIVYPPRPGIVCACTDCRTHLREGKAIIELTQGIRCFILEKPHTVHCCGAMRHVPFTFKSIRGASRFAKRLRRRLQNPHVFSNLRVIPGSLVTQYFKS